MVVRHTLSTLAICARGNPWILGNDKAHTHEFSIQDSTPRDSEGLQVRSRMRVLGLDGSSLARTGSALRPAEA